MGFRSVQPTIPATAATAAATFTTLAHFINVPFGLLIRDVLNNGCDSDEASPYSPAATAPNLTRECNSKHKLVFYTRQRMRTRISKECEGVRSAFAQSFLAAAAAGAQGSCCKASMLAVRQTLR